MPRFVPYGFYPIAVAVVLIVAWPVAAGIAPWPLLPAVVAAAIIAIALLERRFPFEAAWLQNPSDLRSTRATRRDRRPIAQELAPMVARNHG